VEALFKLGLYFVYLSSLHSNKLLMQLLPLAKRIAPQGAARPMSTG
jgi:hypothetical protein